MNELHWKTEKIIQEARKHVIEETGNDIWDFLDEVAHDAEDSVRARYAQYENGIYIDWWEVDIDECFDDDDWDDVRDGIFYEADNYIDFYKEQKAV